MKLKDSTRIVGGGACNAPESAGRGMWEVGQGASETFE